MRKKGAYENLLEPDLLICDSLDHADGDDVEKR